MNLEVLPLESSSDSMYPYAVIIVGISEMLQLVRPSLPAGNYPLQAQAACRHPVEPTALGSLVYNPART